VGGGPPNSAGDDFSTVAGGQANRIANSGSVGSAIGGGISNLVGVSSSYATIPGGLRNQANGPNSFAAGTGAIANHPGVYVWADASDPAEFASTFPNSYLIRAANGVGINTPTPQATLHVKGSARVTEQVIIDQRIEVAGAAKFKSAEVTESLIVSNKFVFGPGTISPEQFTRQLALDSIIPAGTIVAFGGDSSKVPEGWLLCDGSALDKDNPAYARLWSMIGASWGSGAGISGGARFLPVATEPGKTDFNLPDLRGIFLRGVNGTRQGDYSDVSGRTNLLAGSNINGVGSFQRDELRSHTHTFQRSAAFSAGAPRNAIFSDNAINITEFEAGRINPYGGAETRPNNAAVNYIIKL
jgi:microcystin-dependent protein